MKARRYLSQSEDITKLASKLSKIPSVSNLDGVEEPGSWTLAYTFSELENSFLRFAQELIPALLSCPSDPEQLEDILHEVGEELRHIQYHIRDTQYFEYLLE